MPLVEGHTQNMKILNDTDQQHSQQNGPLLNNTQTYEPQPNFNEYPFFESSDQYIVTGIIGVNDENPTHTYAFIT